MGYLNDKPGNAYTVSFSSTSISTAGPVSLFSVKTSSDTRAIVEEIHIGVLTNSANNLAVQLYRGSTSALSTANLVTPVNLSGWANAGAAGSQAATPTTSLPSTTSAVLLDSRTFGEGFSYFYEGHEDVILATSQRFDVVLSTPSVAVIYGTLKFREIGKNPS